MDGELRKKVVRDINRLIVQLLGLGDGKQLCEVDQYGGKSLGRIPFELMILTATNCITQSHMKCIIEEIQLDSLKKKRELSTPIEVWNQIRGEIAKILTAYFVEICEDESGESWANITAYDYKLVGKEELSYYSLILFNVAFGHIGIEDYEEYIEQYIGIPFLAKLISGMEKNIKVWEDEKEVDNWKENAKSMITVLLSEGDSKVSQATGNITDIMGQMRYIVGGRTNAKQVLGEIPRR